MTRGLPSAGYGPHGPMIGNGEETAARLFGPYGTPGWPGR